MMSLLGLLAFTAAIQDYDDSLAVSWGRGSYDMQGVGIADTVKLTYAHNVAAHQFGVYLGSFDQTPSAPMGSDFAYLSYGLSYTYHFRLDSLPMYTRLAFGGLSDIGQNTTYTTQYGSTCWVDLTPYSCLQTSSYPSTPNMRNMGLALGIQFFELGYSSISAEVVAEGFIVPNYLGFEIKIQRGF